jgi:hypothetical protein
MKVRGIVAVMVLSAASMWAQAAASGTAAAPDAAKPAHHAACKHEMAKSGGMKKGCHCMRNKDGMAKDMDGSKHGGCPMMKKEAEKNS